MIAPLTGVAPGVLAGVECRRFDLPLPAPSRTGGTILVVFLTLGFRATEPALAQLENGT